jgi:1-acyl-sn-glycerol-3-phosphate acyltransferase
MFKGISTRILDLLGWKIVGRIPYQQKKFIVIVIPHTSNWDFPLGIIIRSAIGMDIKYLGKDSLFKFPQGILFRLLGGYPVDRSQKGNYVDAVVDIFDSKERFAIALAPEGTRKKVEEIKTGFYYIALGAKIPIFMVKFDYSTKQIIIGEAFYPTGDKDKDFAQIRKYFQGVKGKISEKGWP